MGTMIIIGITMGLIYGLVAMGYSLIWQTMGLLHFAQGDLLMIGGFLALTLINLKITNPFIVLLIVFILTLILGFFIERVVYRMIPQGKPARIISTLGVGITLRNLAVLIWGTKQRSLPRKFFPGSTLTFGDITIQPVYYWTLIIGVFFVVILGFFLYRTRHGLAIRLTAYDLQLARLMGINSGVYQTAVFMLAAGVTGVAGILVSPVSFIHFNMGLSFGVKGFASALIGGLDSLPGSLLGGIILGLAEVVIGRYMSGYVDVLTFVVMILILVFKPKGLLGKNSLEKI